MGHYDRVEYSPDASRLAVVRTLYIARAGTDLSQVVEIYEVGQNRQPTKRVFQFKRPNTMIVATGWAGNRFLFSTNGPQKALPPTAQSTPPQTETIADIRAQSHIHVWPENRPLRGELARIRFYPEQGTFFASPDGRTLLVVDDLSRIASLWRPKYHRFDNSIFYSRFLDVYDFPTGRHIASTTMAIGPVRTPLNRGDWTPIRILPNRTSFLAFYNPPHYHDSHSNGPYLTSINIATRTTKSWPSDTRHEGTSGMSSPLALAAGSKIAYGLRTSWTSKNSTIYFNIANLETGQQEKIRLSSPDLLKAHLPPFVFPITWTPDMRSLVCQSPEGTYLLDWKHHTGRLLSHSHFIGGAVNWLDSNHLLVYAHPLTENDKHVFSDDGEPCILTLSTKQSH